MPQLLNRIGERFGRLEVIERGPTKPNGRFDWICRCDCGNIKPISPGSLQQGLTNSCGCLRKETSSASLKGKLSTGLVDMTGERHGMLTVLYRTGQKYNEGWLWKCQCDCGTLTTGTSGQIRSGHKASCGCARDNRLVVRSEKVRTETNDRKKIRYREDSGFRLCQIVAARVLHVLKAKNWIKQGRTFDILGYTPAALEARLRATMPKGHTWSEFMAGKLHIDHIIPLDAFDFQTEHDDDFKRAWALSNLQLLTGPDNWSKGVKLDWLPADELDFSTQAALLLGED